MLVLVVQYVAGLGTNVYAPPAGFTQNTDFGWYDLHFTTGMVLGFIVIALTVIAVFSRQRNFVVLAGITLVGVILAGIFGMGFVNTTPNNPLYSIGMGVSFLAAFVAGGILAGLINRPEFRRGSRAAPITAA